jgi:hypothetical protein
LDDEAMLDCRDMLLLLPDTRADLVGGLEFEPRKAVRKGEGSGDALD